MTHEDLQKECGQIGWFDLPRVGTKSRENEENDDTKIRIMLIYVEKN